MWCQRLQRRVCSLHEWLLIMREKISKLEDKKFDVELLVSRVNDKTKEIKYDNVPSDIYLTVSNYAEEAGVEESDLEYYIDKVREKVNELESAIYNLVEPFEDKVRDLGCEIDDLEFELEEG